MGVRNERDHLRWFTIAEEISVDRTGRNAVDIDSPGSEVLRKYAGDLLDSPFRSCIEKVVGLDSACEGKRGREEYNPGACNTFKVQKIGAKTNELRVRPECGMKFTHRSTVKALQTSRGIVDP